MTDRELMQQSLGALEANLGNWAAKTKAIAALRSRLEQPESMTKDDIIQALKLAQDALQMATLPFPIDEIKTMRALQAVDKLLKELEQP